MITWQEEDIEDYVCECPELVFGEQYSYIGRQIDVGVGIIDVLLYDGEEKKIAVVEIKNKKVCNNALSQVMRYMQGVKDYYKKNDKLSKRIRGIKGILLGPDIEDDTTTALRLIQDDVKFYRCNVNISIIADEHDFSRNEELSTFKPEKFNELIIEELFPYLNSGYEEDDLVGEKEDD